MSGNLWGPDVTGLMCGQTTFSANIAAITMSDEAQFYDALVYLCG